MVRGLRRLAVIILSLGVLASMITIGQAQEAGDNRRVTSRDEAPEGAVFAMTNETDDNRIITYSRAANGALDRIGSISTRGNGIGVDLDTQSGLELSNDQRFLYAVNAGSDDVTIFSVEGTNLTFLQKVYAGDQPNSVTIHDDLLYVLNGSVAGNGITGFRIASDGTLAPLQGSFRLLSSPIAVPGEVQFSPDGRFLLVTQKTTNVLLKPQNAIDAFRVKSNGLTSATPKRIASHGLRPFSLAFRDDGKLVVTESFNAAPFASALSSYRLTSDGGLSVISGSVPNRQTDTCWVVITDDGRYIFTANFGNGTISTYGFSSTGKIRLLDGNAAFLGTLSQPVDLALSADSRFLHLLLRGTGGVASFRIEENGSLDPLGVVTGGLPVADGASGLAAF
ncbi:MAG: beta-propeller fold lactonase family protein [Actinobacteria bacterium]|nr:beta-propeller fold lactonase family protein [Actinomycetota bacterium]